MCHFDPFFVALVGVILYWTFPNFKVAVDVAAYHAGRAVGKHRSTNLGGDFDYGVRMCHCVIR